MSWIDTLADYQREGAPCVMVTVTATRGSVPREAGVKMVVGGDRQHGTIGGGRLEHECAAIARGLLDATAPVMREFPLGPALGQCCGGHATVLFEPVVPAWQVALFGAGHVGRALVHLLATLPCQVRWVDSRSDEYPDVIPDNVVRVPTGRPELEVAALPDASMALVMTHDHALDYRIVSACLRRDLAFVGLIGSATKRARFASRLRADGVSVDRLNCPIGVPDAGGKLPAEIAISVAAQLLQVRARPRAAEVIPLRSCSACRECA